MEGTLLFWSGGKDSALSLHELAKSDEFDVAGLVVTLTLDGRVGMHGVPVACVRRQAAALGLPLIEVSTPASPSNDAYLEAVRDALLPWRDQGAGKLAFGDLFLDDIRRWREREFETLGYQCVFPIWGKATDRLSHDFIALGFRATVVTVDTTQLPASFCGRELDIQFLHDLPRSADPAGEQGEFHTFVWDGPCFNEALTCEVSGTRRDEQFVFANVSCAE